MQKLKIKLILFILFVLFFAITHAGVAQQSSQDSVSNLIDFQTRKFRSILESLYEYSKDTVDVIAASDSAFSAMLKSTNPQNLYYSKDIWTKYLSSSLGKSKSIGISTSLLGDLIFIIDVDKNSPAEKAGLLRGDIIVSVNNIKARNIELAHNTQIDNNSNLAISSELSSNYKEIFEELKCDLGDTVVLQVKKTDTNSIKTIEIICSEYSSPSISSYFIFPKENIAYLQISRFSVETAREFKDLVLFFKKNNISGFIIDLRSNGGGSQSSVLSFLDEFIPEGNILSEIFARREEFQNNIISSSGGSFETTPIIVLINNNSASASEVFAGAIQDLDRGLILGERSFGKGTMQKLWDLIDTTGYRITVAEFVTPSGRRIEKTINREKILLDPALELTNPEIYSSISDKVKSNELPTQLNIHHTKNKRIIIEYGGVTPDYTIKEDTLTLLTEVLSSKRIILEFVFRNPEIFPNKYKNNFTKFLFEYTISDSLLQELRVFSYNIKKTWNEEMFLKDKEIIRNRLKAYIAHYVWGNSAYQAVLAVSNKAVKFALEKKNETINILKSTD